jgi:hypothetical protein
MQNRAAHTRSGSLSGAICARLNAILRHALAENFSNISPP